VGADTERLPPPDIISRRSVTTRHPRRRLRVTRIITIIITDTTMTATAAGSHWAPPWSEVSSAVFAAGSGESFQTL
jgi:hypothetical protein